MVELELSILLWTLLLCFDIIISNNVLNEIENPSKSIFACKSVHFGIKNKKEGGITESHLSEACHLLSLPASSRQGADGHLAGSDGITGLAVKCRTGLKSTSALERARGRVPLWSSRLCACAPY